MYEWGWDGGDEGEGVFVEMWCLVIGVWLVLVEGFVWELEGVVED